MVPPARYPFPLLAFCAGRTTGVVMDLNTRKSFQVRRVFPSTVDASAWPATDTKLQQP